MRAKRLVVWSLAVLGTACRAVIGIDDLSFDRDDAAAGAAGAGAAGAAGAGAAGIAGASGAGTGGVAGTGGAAGTAGLAGTAGVAGAAGTAGTAGTAGAAGGSGGSTSCPQSTPCTSNPDVPATPCAQCLARKCCEPLTDCLASATCKPCLTNAKGPGCTTDAVFAKVWACEATTCSANCVDECNPVTGSGCSSTSSCDTSVDGSYGCYDNDNVALCAPCDGQNGPYCGPTLTCVQDEKGKAVCARFCCDDGDCGGGNFCDKSITADAFVGVCVDTTGATACQTPFPAPSGGACKATCP